MMNPLAVMLCKCVPIWIISSFLLITGAIAQGTATYELTFTSTWSATTHPTGFPSNPHFSGLIGGTHNSSVSFWNTGETASDGIKDMAEFGGTSTLRSEVNQAINASNAGEVIAGGGIGNSPGSVRTTFEVTSAWSLVTVTSMLAPSPDWFVGVSGLNLLDSDNLWRRSVQVELFVYDAGTDSGTNYGSPNQATNPRENIHRITTAPFLVNGTVRSVGMFSFELQSSTTPQVSLSVDQNSVAEGEAVTATVELSQALSSAVTIPLNLRSVTAESGDYDSSSPVNVSIPAGQTEADLAINTYPDEDTEDEIFMIEIDRNNLPSSVTAGSPLSQEIVITDLAPPSVSLSVNPPSVEEGKPVAVSVELSRSLTGDLTASLILTAGTAEAEDYDSSSPVSITIPGGRTRVEHIINTYEDDDLDDETFTVDLDTGSLISDVTAGTSISEEVTILDTTEPTLVNLSVDQNSVDEGTSVTVTAALSKNIDTDITIPLILTPGTAELEDYDSTTPVNLEIQSGENMAELVIKTYMDDDLEDETFLVMIDEANLPSGILSGSQVPAEITIIDDDMPGVSLSVDQNSVTEGESVTVTITVPVGLDTDITVPLILTSNTAEMDDYDSTSPINVTIKNGDTEAEHVIKTYEDDDLEDETFTVAIDGDNLPAGVVLGDPASAEIAITDNDMPPSVSLTVTPDHVEEGDSVIVAVKLSTSLDADAMISLILTPGTAEADDYDSTSPVSVTVTAGQTEGQQVIRTSEDADTEDETFTVAIDRDNLPSGVIPGAPTSAEITITDTDMPGLSAPESVEVDEGQSATIQISLMTEPAGEVTVTITGQANSDLTPDPPTLTFTQTNYSTAQTVILTVTEDDDLLNDEVTLTLTASGGGYEVSHTLVVTIIDNMGVGIEDEQPSLAITLWGNYPNPVSDLTKIEFDLPEPAQISVRVTDLLGRIVQTTPYGWFEVGKGHTVELSTDNLTSGVYYYTLTADMGEQVIQRSRAMSIVK